MLNSSGTFFFAEARSEQYSIYVHRAKIKDNATSPSVVPLSKWGATAIPWVRSQWCSLMGVEVALLSAALQDPHNANFVFLSQDAAPLKSFDYVYQRLVVDSVDRSKFCFSHKATTPYISYDSLVNEVTPSCVYKDYYSWVNPRTPKHHQWIILVRRHAMTLVQNFHSGLAAWNQSWFDAAPDLSGDGEGCSDEGVPAATLLHNFSSSGQINEDLHNLGIDRECATFVNWHNCFHGSLFELPPEERRDTLMKELKVLWNSRDDAVVALIKRLNSGSDFALKRETNEYPHGYHFIAEGVLNALVHQGFMFMRKVEKDMVMTAKNGSQIAITEALPKLWKTVEPEYASRMIWTMLEVEGQPKSQQVKV